MDARAVLVSLSLCSSLAVAAGCPASPGATASRVKAAPDPRPPARGPARPAPDRPARCARAQGGPLPSPVRSVLHVGGYRILTSGLRVSERPPCAGACAPPETTITLVDDQGVICFKATLRDEHRLGPVARPGGTLFVAGPRRVHAVGWDGRRLATTVTPGLVGEPVSLEDGGAAFVDAEGYLLVFRANGRQRYRKRPQTPTVPVALASRPGGGMLVAFGREVRGYDADGVEMFQRALPDLSQERTLLALSPMGFWVWSARGAYRLGADGAVESRLPPRAPSDGQLFAAALGSDGVFYALFAEQGFHPVRLAAFLPKGAPHWSRPYTGARPSRCRLLPAAKRQLGVLCEGDPLGRAVARDHEGITRFDEELMRPQLAFGPDGAFAVAEDRQARDMTDRCRVRRFGPTGDDARTSERAGRCPVLWADGSGALYLGHERLDPHERRSPGGSPGVTP